MFSKKKKIDTPPLIFSDDPDAPDKRDAYRYVFPDGQHLSTTFKGKQVKVLDISAGGLAFENISFHQYDADRITLTLDIPNFTGDPKFTAWTRILHITSNNICHCIFEDCRVEEYEIIHKYVLELQKRDLSLLRKKKMIDI